MDIPENATRWTNEDGNIEMRGSHMVKVPALVTVWSPDPEVARYLMGRVHEATTNHPAFNWATSGVDLQVVKMTTPSALDVMKTLVKGEYFRYNENFINAYPDKDHEEVRRLQKEND